MRKNLFQIAKNLKKRLLYLETETSKTKIYSRFKGIFIKTK